MTVYLDTSNLVKLYVQEPDSDAVTNLINDADVVVTSVLAYAEARATFARQCRERRLTAAESSTVIRQLDDDWRHFVVIALDHELALAAGRLADRHGVRGGDTVHLASFEHLRLRCDDDDIRFSCADERLVRAARSFG